MTDYPFGAVMRETNTLTLAESKIKCQNKERDTETGYDYFEAWMYDSQLGRFMQVDPHGEKYVTMNPFVGMGDNPILTIDPTGMDWYEYEDENGKKSAFWREGNGKSIDVSGTTYINVGTTYSRKIDDQITISFTQNEVTSMTTNTLNSEQWVSQYSKSDWGGTPANKA